MRSQYCRGIVEHPVLSKPVQCTLKLSFNRPRFFEARGVLLLAVRDQLPHAQSVKWFVGRFSCTDPIHEFTNHVYSLKAGDAGSIDVFEKRETDEVVLQVVAMRTDNPNKVEIQRPKVNHE